MKDMSVLLIGGGGFVGRHVAQALIRAGARVRIAQRRPRDAWTLSTWGDPGQVGFAAIDIRIPETLDRAAEGVDAVVNLVGSWDHYHALHVKGAQNAAQAAARAGARAYVHVSALGADPAGPSEYARTKARGEDVTREAFPGATILRPSTIFGVGDQFVNRFAAMIAAWPVVPVLRPHVRFQPVWAGDVARITARALSDPDTHRARIYSLGGPDVLSMYAILRWIADASGRGARFLPLPDPVGALLSMMPGGPIRRDQWRLLKHDNIVPEGAPGFAEAGMAPVPFAVAARPLLALYSAHRRPVPA